MATRSFGGNATVEDDQAAAIAEYRKQARAQNRREAAEHAGEEEEARKAYLEGKAEGRRTAEERAKKKRTHSRSSSSKRRPPAKRRRRAPRPVRTAARQIARPLERQATSGLQVLGLTLGVVALYLVLENAGAAAGALGAVARGLDWLRAPDRSIPFNGPR